MMLQGVVVLKLQPGKQWVAAVQDSVLQQLDRLGARDISQVRVLVCVDHPVAGAAVCEAEQQVLLLTHTDAVHQHGLVLTVLAAAATVSADSPADHCP